MIEMIRLNKKKILFVALSALAGMTLLAGLAGLTSRDRGLILATSKQITVGGIERSYREHTAKSTTKKIIVLMHGFNGSGRGISYFTGLHNVVDDNTTVLYPDALSNNTSGLLRGWNADFCCGAGWQDGVDDVAFILELIETIKAEQAADEAKVFVTGFSNGAFLAHRLAAEKPNEIDGFAAVAGTIGTSTQQFAPSRPVPVLLVHGVEDGIVSYNGGPGSDPNFDWLPFEETAAVWSRTNKCTSAELDPLNSAKTKQTYQDCTAPLQTIVYKNGGHTWGDWRVFNVWHSKPQLSRDIVEFFNTL